MNGPSGVDMVAAVGITDRGTLWRARRQRPNDRIVRVIEPRFVDGAFRQAVANLRQRQQAGMIEITSHEWTADGRYYVEYAVDTPWRTLAEQLTELAGWQDRVKLLERVCSLFARWQRSPVHPLGLSMHNIVVVAEEEHWRPWLLPCPPVTLATPCDLFGVDTMAVAALAPEVVRGMQPDSKAVDSYALGALVVQALGDNDMPPAMADEDRVEAQARGVLWPHLTAGTRIPTTLHDTPVGEELFRAVEHYRQTAPSARPADAEELWSALAALADPVSIAEIAAERGDHEAALRYLDDAVRSAPRRVDLRRRRHEAAWRVFAPLPRGRRSEQLGALILEDIAKLTQTMPDDDTTLYERAVEVHLRLGDPGAAAGILYAALERDWSDLNSLDLYCRCWRELGDRGKVRQSVIEAERRIDRLLDAQELTAGEARQWYERFARHLS